MKYRNLKKITALLIFFAAIACKKDVHVNPKINSIEPTIAAANDVITVTGSGLRNVQNAVLDLGNIHIEINSSFNTDKTILFRVPANANEGAQHVVFTSAGGYQYSASFTVKK